VPAGERLGDTSPEYPAGDERACIRASPRPRARLSDAGGSQRAGARTAMKRRRRSLAYGSSNKAMLSTCAVCGNMLTAPAAAQA
jgi:hypothetical protein